MSPNAGKHCHEFNLLKNSTWKDKEEMGTKLLLYSWLKRDSSDSISPCRYTLLRKAKTHRSKINLLALLLGQP
jgi:hypothetical protein